MRTSLILLAFFILTALSCNDKFEGDKLLTFSSFSLKTPSNWYKFDLQGYDSQIGGITNRRDSLLYDFGWYSNNLSTFTSDTHLRTTALIDGYDALIVQPLDAGKGLIGLTVQVDNMNRFTLYGYSDQESTILTIFHSVQFN